MDINLPISSFYPKDDSKFIDPMYVPYQREKMPIDNQNCYINLNRWKHNGDPKFVHPDHYRIDWNQNFQRIHPSDPCPSGWTDTGNNDGMCTRVPEESSNFYTSKQFRVQHQYFNGYTVNPNKNLKSKKNSAVNIEDSPTFSGASMNPHTGNYVIYFDPKPHKNSVKYNKLPTRSSYLGK